MERTFGPRTAYIPVREQLVVLQARRLRLARRWFLGLGVSWGAAIAVALIAQVAPASSQVGPIAGALFFAGLGCTSASIVLLLQRVSTIPIRSRGLIGDDRVASLRIFDAHPAFVAALDHGPAPNGLGIALPAPESLGTALPGLAPGRLDRRLRLISYGVGCGLPLLIFLFLVLRHLSSSDLPDLIILAVVLAAVGVVAAASTWRIHIGQVFTLTPATTVAIIGCVAVAAVAGLILALSAQPDTAGVETAVGLGAAGAVIVVMVVAQIIWHWVRPH